jgi:Ciliary basal body-associated, B9 protein
MFQTTRAILCAAANSRLPCTAAPITCPSATRRCDGREALWNHPIDVHYGMDSFKGWPRLQLQVWQLDAHDRSVESPCVLMFPVPQMM